MSKENQEIFLETLRWYFFARQEAAHKIANTSNEQLKKFLLSRASKYIDVMNEIATLINNEDFLNDFNNFLQKRLLDDEAIPDDDQILQHELESIK